MKFLLFHQTIWVNLQHNLRTRIDLSEIPIEVECPKKWKDILAQTDAATVKEVDIYQCLIQHLKSPSYIPKKADMNLMYYCTDCLVVRDCMTQCFYISWPDSCANYSNLKKSVDT